MTLATWVPVVLIVLCVPVWIAAGVVGANAPTGPVQGNSALVFTTWVPDSSVTDGPEPGFKPALTGLTGLDVASASAAIDPNGTAWSVNVVFTKRGGDLFAQLTRDNVSACQADCAQRHLAIWIGLTQTDIDAWSDALYVARVTQPFGQGGYLVSDPITLTEIDGAQTEVSAGLDQQDAAHLATVIGPRRRRMTRGLLSW